MNNVIATIIKFATQGASAAASAVGGVHKAATVAARGMATLASSLGSLGGPLGDAASQVANFIFSVRQMGAVGGIIAGAQMAISLACEKIIKSYDKMLEKIESAGEKIRDRLQKIDDTELGNLKDELDAATTKAQEAAKAFDTMAAAYMKVEKAKADTEKSGANAALSGLSLEKSRAMAGAKDENERATIGAAYDEKIARAKLASTTNEHSAAVAGAEDELTQSRHRARSAKRTENAAKRAMDDAASKLATMENVGRDEAELDKYRAAKDAAEKAYANAVNDRIAKEADAEVAEEKLKQSKLNQTAALNEARREVVEAESAAKQLADAQIKAAQAELEREKAAQKAAEAERRKAAADEKRAALAEKKDSAASEVSRWQGEFNAAFDLWRDPEARSRRSTPTRSAAKT